MRREGSGIAAFYLCGIAIGIMIGVIIGVLADDNDNKGPRGKITQKMWVQEFWQGGEKLYPDRYCLELNYRDEVCFGDIETWNKYGIGDMYGN